MAINERLELGEYILRTLGAYGSIFNHCDVIGQQSKADRFREKRKIRAITPYKDN